MPQFVEERGLQIFTRCSRKNSHHDKIDNYDFYQEHQCWLLTENLDLELPFFMLPAAGVYHTANTEENQSVSINSEFTISPCFLLQYKDMITYPCLGKVVLKMLWLITSFSKITVSPDSIQFPIWPSGNKTFPMLKCTVCS